MASTAFSIVPYDVITITAVSGQCSRNRSNRAIPSISGIFRAVITMSKEAR